MPGEAAAAALVWWRENFNAIAREDLDRGGVDIRIKNLLSATQEERDARATFASRRRNCRPALSRRQGSRQQVEHRTNSFWQEPGQWPGQPAQSHGETKPAGKRNCLRGDKAAQLFAQRDPPTSSGPDTKRTDQ